MKKPFLPIEYEEIHDAALDAFIVTGTISRDFGPWKKGEGPLTLAFDFNNGKVVEIDDNTGEPLRTAEFWLEIIDSKDLR